MAKEFNATHPKLKVIVTQTQIADDVTKLATAIRAGDPPDLIGLDLVNMPVFTANGSFLDLTPYVSQLPYKDALSKGHLNIAAYQGKNYGVPYLADLSVLWYNKDLFKRAGLDPSTPPANYADILADAKKISAFGNGIYGFSFAGNCPGCLGFTQVPNMAAANQNIINGTIPNQTANVASNQALSQTLQLYRQIYAQHLNPPSDRTENGSTWGKLFTAGKVGIFPASYGISLGSGAGLDPKLAAKIADTPIPGPNGGYATFDGGDDFAIPAKAKNASGAWEFVKFVLDQQQQVQYPKLGFTPVRTDVLTPQFKQQNPFDAVALQALTHGYVPTTLAYNQAFNAASAPYFSMFSKAVYDGDLQGALKEGQDGITSALQQSGSA